MSTEREGKPSSELSETSRDLARLRREVEAHATVIAALRAELATTKREAEMLRAEATRAARQLHGVEKGTRAALYQLQHLWTRVGILESPGGLRGATRGMRRAVTRRLFEFTAQPTQQLLVVDSTGRWESSGSGAGFALVPKDGRYPGSWVLLDFEFDLEGDRRARPSLWIDPGTGYGEQTIVRLPPPRQGRIRTVVLLPKAVHGLRFAPADRIATFRVGRLAMREIGRVELGMLSLAPVARALRSNPRHVPTLWRRARELLRRGGVQAIKDQLSGTANRADAYSLWVEQHDRLDEADVRDIEARIARLSRRPLLSVVMPVYDAEERWLRRAIESVRSQLYPDWELCIADDASPSPHVRRVLEEYAASDPRIKVVFREENGHISAASNSALALATGDYVVLLDNDDELPRHALYLVAEEIAAHPDVDLIYSDEDKIDERGRRYDAYFKPGWNPDMFASQNYFSHLGVYRTSLVRRVGGFRSVTDGSQDYDLALRCLAQTRDDNVRHIPFVLYHWRAVEGSGAHDAHAKSFAANAARRALSDHFTARDPRIEVSFGKYPTTYRVRHPVPDPAPLVTVIVPTRDGHVLLRRCLDGLFHRTDYPRIEVIVVSNLTRDPDALEQLRALRASDRVRVLHYDRPYNFSAINNLAAGAAGGELLLLLNDDVEVLHGDWLGEMVSQAVRPEIGAVGAKLLYADGTIQHAGVVLGLWDLAGHVHRGLWGESPGYFGRAHLVQAVSAVTGACLLIRKKTYDEVGGLDEKNLPVAFNDIDFCIRVREAGYRNLWTPYAELRHYESLTRPHDTDLEQQLRFHGEVEYMKRRWGKAVVDDPYYSPNLSLRSDHAELAWPPRVRRPWAPDVTA